MKCINCKAYHEKNREYGVCGVLCGVERNWIVHKNGDCVIDDLLRARKEANK